MHIQYLLAGNYARGGIRVQIEHANHLARRGHQVVIVSPFDEADWIEVKVPWRKIEIQDGDFLGTRIPPADVTVFSFYEQAFALYDKVEELKSMPVYLAQGDELLFGDTKNAETKKKKADIAAAQASLKIPFPLITVSSWAKQFIENHGGDKVKVIPNGIDAELFRPNNEKNNSPLRILSVGAEHPKTKGIELIYAAVMKLKSDPQCPEFTFVRASPHKNILASLPVEVEFHQNPPQQELAKLYADADVFVGASSLESFYLLPLEAMASGTAVVCSNLPAIRDYAKPERDYLPFSPGDIAGMYNQIKFALLSAQSRTMLVNNGLQVARGMTWPAIVERLEKHLEILVSQRTDWLEKLKQHKKENKLRYRFVKHFPK